MAKITVIGASGRMGQMIINSINKTEGATLAGALEMEGHETLGKDAGDIAGVGNLGVAITDDFAEAIKDCDVTIDFTSPMSTLHNVDMAIKAGKKAVIGTTGFSKDELGVVDFLSKKGSIVLAPNMSMGINLLARLVEEAARTLHEEYDIEIIDMHHSQKKDAPSGTAIQLGECAAHGRGSELSELGVYERYGIIGERKKGTIGIQTIRGGDIVGDHTVIFAGPGERLELTHRAHSRETFASGAVTAAMWLSDKDKGLYDMQDVLGLK